MTAFTIPLYNSAQLTSLQQLFIVLAILCFLLSIVLGVSYLLYILDFDERSMQNQARIINVVKQKDAATEEDMVNAYKQYKKTKDERIKYKLVGWCSERLFLAGIIGLLCVLGVGVWFK